MVGSNPNIIENPQYVKDQHNKEETCDFCKQGFDWHCLDCYKENEDNHESAIEYLVEGTKPSDFGLVSFDNLVICNPCLRNALEPEHDMTERYGGLH